VDEEKKGIAIIIQDDKHFRKQHRELLTESIKRKLETSNNR